MGRNSCGTMVSLFGGIEGPKVGIEHHDIKVKVCIFVFPLHLLIELISEVFAQTHVGSRPRY